MNATSFIDKKKRRAPPLSLRLSAEERARLECDAAGLSLSAYIKGRLFGEDAPRRITRGKAPVKDHQVLAQLLALLGTSHLANNLNLLARAAHTGSLPVTPDTEEELRQACVAVTAMRLMLMQALGMQVDEPKPAPRIGVIAAFRGCAKPAEVPR